MTAPPEALHTVTTDVNRTESWQWHRVLSVVEQCTARPFVASVFEHRRGAHRVLTTDAFLAAYLTHSFVVKDNLHQTQITNTIRGWTASQRIAVGLAPDAVITYKMVTDGLARLGRACESRTYPELGRREVRSVAARRLAAGPLTDGCGRVGLDRHPVLGPDPVPQTGRRCRPRHPSLSKARPLGDVACAGRPERARRPLRLHP